MDIIRLQMQWIWRMDRTKDMWNVDVVEERLRGGDGKSKTQKRPKSGKWHHDSVP